MVVVDGPMLVGIAAIVSAIAAVIKAWRGKE